MKVFENLKRYGEEILATMGLSTDEKFMYHDQIERALKDLIPIRKNRQLTTRYFETNLCRDKYKDLSFI